MGIELQFLNLIQEIRTTFLDVFMSNVTKLGNVGFIWILLTIILLVIPKTRKSGVILAAALIVDLILCNVILKPLVARIRPFDVNTAIQLIIAKPQDYSFPSGHTAASVASVVALYLAGEKRLWKIALILACFIAFSRMYLYVEHDAKGKTLIMFSDDLDKALATFVLANGAAATGQPVTIFFTFWGLSRPEKGLQ